MVTAYAHTTLQPVHGEEEKAGPEGDRLHEATGASDVEAPGAYCACRRQEGQEAGGHRSRLGTPREHRQEEQRTKEEELVRILDQRLASTDKSKGQKEKSSFAY